MTLTRQRIEDKYIDIDSVKVNGRVRKDLGDLEKLKESITKVELLHPIVIAPDRTLIAGHRRLEALRQLGWRSVPVRIVDEPTEALRLEAERDENTCRLDMKPTEMLALTEQLKALEEAKIDRSEIGRQAAAAREAKRQGIVSDFSVHDRRPSAAEKAAAAAGWNSKTYAHAKEVVKRAEGGNPVAEEALAEMDRTGEVEPAWRKATGTPPRPRLQVIDLTKSKNRASAEAKKGRLAKVIYGLEGTAQGFGEVDFRYVLAVADSAELAEWDRILALTSRSITALRKRLKEGTVTE